MIGTELLQVFKGVTTQKQPRHLEMFRGVGLNHDAVDGGAECDWSTDMVASRLMFEQSTEVASVLGPSKWKVRERKDGMKP